MLIIALCFKNLRYSPYICKKQNHFKTIKNIIMKKTIFLFGIAAFLSAITLYNCKKDATTTTTKSAKITGTVTYESSLKAGGAIVTISSSPNAAAVITKVVTDADGKYTVPGLADGTYYLSAKYNTANTNLKSATDIFFTTGSEINVAVSGSDLVKDIALVSSTASGTDVIEYTASKEVGKWSLDQTHSRIGFTFPYDSVNSVFFGTFTWYGLNSFKFDQTNLANSSIDAWVDITSTETGAPTLLDTVNRKLVLGGRDGLNGCISHTFLVLPTATDTFFTVSKTDTSKKPPVTTVTKYYRPSAVINSASTTSGKLIPSAKATFVSTSITAYGDGYVAAGKMTFIKGVDVPVNLYFHYIKGFASKVSFNGYFKMNPSQDFGMPKSGHVGVMAGKDPVDINISLQFVVN